MKNIYILAMEYGYKHTQGFKYSDLKNSIELRLYYTLNQDAEYGLVDWFLESFASVEIFENHEKTAILQSYRVNVNYPKFSNSTWVIKGKTTKQYIDYLELKESRENSKKAYIISLISISIAVLSFLAPIVLSFLSPKPVTSPIDVKIIENLKESKQLEKENSELKEKLFKAEMIISIYEDDEFKN